jgi:hypothetical protein
MNSDQFIIKEISPDHPDFLSGIPETLYKYRDWEISFHRDLIMKGDVYFSSFDQLNDPFEGAIPFRYHSEQMTEENMKQKFRKYCKETTPYIDENEINVRWESELKIKLWENNDHLREHEAKARKSFNEIFGIYSLSESRDKYLLWSYYANSHKGICIGFNSKKLVTQLLCSIAKVDYVSDIPRLDIFEHPMMMGRKLTETKGAIWSHEGEYRLKKMNHARKALKINPDAIEEIIFGVKTEEKIKAEIIESVLSLNKDVRFYQAALNDNKFVLDIIPF